MRGTLRGQVGEPHALALSLSEWIAVGLIGWIAVALLLAVAWTVTARALRRRHRRRGH